MARMPAARWRATEEIVHLICEGRRWCLLRNLLVPSLKPCCDAVAVPAARVPQQWVGNALTNSSEAERFLDLDA